MEGFNDPRIMALLGAGSGLLQASAPSPVPMSFAGAMGNAFPAALQGAQAAYGFQNQEMLRKRLQDEALQKIEAQEFLKQHQQSGTDPRSLIQAAAMSGNPQLMTMAGTMQKALPRVKSTQKGIDEEGNARLFNVFDTGEMTSTGISPAEKAMQVNTGDAMKFLDPYSLQARGQSMPINMSQGQQSQLAQSARHHADSMGMQAQNLGLARENADFGRQLKMMQLDPEFQAQRAGMIAKAKTSGGIQAQAESNLPGAVTQATQSIQAAEDLLNHPGFDNSVGVKSPYGAVKAFVPGTDEADWKSRFEQVEGKKFLGGIEALRGFGQITEKEGAAAAQAYSRMNRATSQQEFIRAAREFQDSMRQGVGKIAAQAGIQAPRIQPVNNFSNGDDDRWGDVR